MTDSLNDIRKSIIGRRFKIDPLTEIGWNFTFDSQLYHFDKTKMLIKVLISVLIPGSKSNKDFAPAVAPVANVSTPVGRDAILQCFVSIPKSINNIDAIRVSFNIW